MSEKLIVWRETAAIREQLQFLKQRMQQPLLPGIAQQVDASLYSLRVLENLTRQYHEQEGGQ